MNAQRQIGRSKFVMFAVLLLILSPPRASAEDTPPKTEPEKIEALLKHVGDMKNSKFVRNGVAYSPKDAVRFLRGKWDSNKADATTATKFIEICASKSTTSGKPYLIRLKDGKEQKSEEYLKEVLKKLETPKKVIAVRHVAKV